MNKQHFRYTVKEIFHQLHHNPSHSEQVTVRSGMQCFAKIGMQFCFPKADQKEKTVTSSFFQTLFVQELTQFKQVYHDA